mgnify:CR=1 FL=1|tara:strand:- start:19 stop:666 length:648 start_codon:yes stop_codon:yes gene_type:complete
MVLGNIANSIFGTPNKDKAEAEQANIWSDYLGRLAKSNNLGTKATILEELSIRNHGTAISNDNRRAIHAQNQYYKSAESVAKLAGETYDKGVSGGSENVSRTKGRKQNLMLLSQLDKAEDVVRYTKGEGAAMASNAALNNYWKNFGEAQQVRAQGLSAARRGVTYTDDTAGNMMKLGKLAISAATGTPPIGMFGEFSGEAGGNASLWQMLTKQTV